MPATTGPGTALTAIPADLSPAEFARLFALGPEGAMGYLAGRDALRETYDWRALWQGEHAYQFTVSRLARLDLLAAIQAAIEQSVAGDLTRVDFQRDIEAMLRDAGWWGTVETVDPSTGEVLATTFSPSRLALIWDVNTRMANAAGRWERFQASKATHPYLRYITKGDERVRASHAAWNNVTLPIDHPFWTSPNHSHYPPNGWRCRCRVIAMSQAEYDRGISPTGARLVKDAPVIETRPWLNTLTGETLHVPVGIDPGFGYNVGIAAARARGLRAVVAQKVASVGPDLAAGDPTLHGGR